MNGAYFQFEYNGKREEGIPISKEMLHRYAIARDHPEVRSCIDFLVGLICEMNIEARLEIMGREPIPVDWLDKYMREGFPQDYKEIMCDLFTYGFCIIRYVPVQADHPPMVVKSSEAYQKVMMTPHTLLEGMRKNPEEGLGKLRDFDDAAPFYLKSWSQFQDLVEAAANIEFMPRRCDPLNFNIFIDFDKYREPAGFRVYSQPIIHNTTAPKPELLTNMRVFTRNSALTLVDNKISGISARVMINSEVGRAIPLLEKLSSIKIRLDNLLAQLSDPSYALEHVVSKFDHSISELSHLSLGNEPILMRDVHAFKTQYDKNTMDSILDQHGKMKEAVEQHNGNVAWGRYRRDGSNPQTRVESVWEKTTPYIVPIGKKIVHFERPIFPKDLGDEDVRIRDDIHKLFSVPSAVLDGIPKGNSSAEQAGNLIDKITKPKSQEIVHAIQELSKTILQDLLSDSIDQEVAVIITKLMQEKHSEEDEKILKAEKRKQDERDGDEKNDPDPEKTARGQSPGVEGEGGKENEGEGKGEKEKAKERKPKLPSARQVAMMVLGQLRFEVRIVRHTTTSFDMLIQAYNYGLIGRKTVQNEIIQQLNLMVDPDDEEAESEGEGRSKVRGDEKNDKKKIKGGIKKIGNGDEKMEAEVKNKAPKRPKASDDEKDGEMPRKNKKAKTEGKEGEKHGGESSKEKRKKTEKTDETDEDGETKKKNKKNKKGGENKDKEKKDEKSKTEKTAKYHKEPESKKK